MSYRPFHDLFLEIARRETRSIPIGRGTEFGLPPGRYTLIELYCADGGCDCRRVFLQVVSSAIDRPLAVIAFGWESDAFYARWARDDDPEVIHELKGPILNMASDQSNLADAILRMVSAIPLRDASYVDQLKTHYRLFRDAVDGATSPFGRRTNR